MNLTRQQARNQATQQLRYELVMDAREAQTLAFLLLEFVTGENRTAQLLKAETPLTSVQEEFYTAGLKRLLAHEPIQYIMGTAPFFALELEVGPGVLIPRPETEELVREALRLIKPLRTQPCILDACTGSGCIALALKSFRPDAQVQGFDASNEALAYARRNAERTRLNVLFHQADLYQLEPEAFGKLDLLIANPPYVPLAELGTLRPTVRDHEPHLALFVTDEDPLKPYRALLEFGAKSLNAAGWVAFELHPPFAQEVAHLASELGYAEGQVQTDLQGRDRMFFAQRSQ
jgi:release factor glutamine methyltransferase